MEWTKYVLALTVGGCLLILFGRNEDGRDKWLLGGGAGICLAAMELTVEYMWGDETWKMIVSVCDRAEPYAAAWAPAAEALWRE